MPGPGRRVRRHAVPHGQDLDAADDNERCRSTSSMPLLAETSIAGDLHRWYPASAGHWIPSRPAGWRPLRPAAPDPALLP